MGALPRPLPPPCRWRTINRRRGTHSGWRTETAEAALEVSQAELKQSQWRAGKVVKKVAESCQAHANGLAKQPVDDAEALARFLGTFEGEHAVGGLQPRGERGGRRREEPQGDGREPHHGGAPSLHA